MMYIKLLVLVGFDLNFPLISGIYKLHQMKASFPTFQLSRFIIVIHFTLTTKICKKNWIYFTLSLLISITVKYILKLASNIKNSFTLRGKRCYFFESSEMLL